MTTLLQHFMIWMTALAVLGSVPTHAVDPETNTPEEKNAPEQEDTEDATPETETPASIKGSSRLTLEDLLRSTIQGNAEIEEAKMDTEVALQQLARAKAALWPRASATIIAAPIFGESGNALSSTSDLSKWGPFFTGGIQIVQPLYTFGQVGNYKKAAQHQIAAKQGLAEAKEDEILLRMKEFYYGYLMASELNKLVGSLVDYLTEAVNTAEKGLKSKKKNGIKPEDVYELKVNLDDLKQKQLLASQSMKTAEKAVKWVSTSQFESLGKRKLKPQKYELQTLEKYIALAKANRPEFRALTDGQKAYKALADAKSSQSYPVLFVGGFASFAWTSVREDQKSVFALDQFNNFQGGGGIGLQFDLEFKRHAAEAAEQRAEAMKLQAKEKWAAPGIELEVKKAYWELEQAIEGLKIAKQRKRTARKWFVSSAMGWSIGITPARKIMDALEGDGKAKQNYIETVYSLNMALANLSKAVGKEITTLKYH